MKKINRWRRRFQRELQVLLVLALSMALCIGVKPQIISGEIRKLFPVKMPVAICGQRQDCTLFQL